MSERSERPTKHSALSAHAGAERTERSEVEV
jgi:hypothetical protein